MSSILSFDLEKKNILGNMDIWNILLSLTTTRLLYFIDLFWKSDGNKSKYGTVTDTYPWVT